jgi:hypothetical protein
MTLYMKWREGGRETARAGGGRNPEVEREGGELRPAIGRGEGGREGLRPAICRREGEGDLEAPSAAGCLVHSSVEISRVRERKREREGLGGRGLSR